MNIPIISENNQIEYLKSKTAKLKTKTKLRTCEMA